MTAGVDEQRSISLYEKERVVETAREEGALVAESDVAVQTGTWNSQAANTIKRTLP